MLTLQSTFVATPIGTLEIAATERGITSLSFVERPGKDAADYAHLLASRAQVEEYFAGKRRMFTDLPLAIAGTAFSQDVWDVVSHVPYGATLTYGQVAAMMGKEGSARAVGGAVGRNPLTLIIPCHRIVRSEGGDAECEGLGGYAWGAERKKWLLDWEKKIAARE
jgi:methylated-DNA-[protein]-cysteine S-methyltransferase